MGASEGIEPLGHQKERYIGWCPPIAGIIAAEGPDGYSYCAPCQTIEQTCSDNPAVMESQTFCPVDRYYRKTEKEVDREARMFITHLQERNCQIFTEGSLAHRLVDHRVGVLRKQEKVKRATLTVDQPLQLDHYSKEDVAKVLNDYGMEGIRVVMYLVFHHDGGFSGKAGDQASALAVVQALEEAPPHLALNAIAVLSQIETMLNRRKDKPFLWDKKPVEPVIAQVKQSRDVLKKRVKEELGMTAPILFPQTARVSGSWQEAVQTLELVIQNDPAGMEEYGQLVELYLYRRPDKARVTLNRLKTLDFVKGRELEVAYLEAEVLMAEGRFKEAERIFQRHQNKTATFPAMVAGLGEFYLRTHQQDKAAGVFARLQKNDPSFLKVYALRMGQVFHLRKQWEQAERLYRTQIARLESESVEPCASEGMKPCTSDRELLLKTRDLLAVVLWMQDRIDEAREEFSKVLQTDPDHPDTLYNLASMEYEQGKKNRDLSLLEQAKQLYDRILTLQGFVDDATYGKAQCLEKLGQKEEAHRMFEALAFREKPYPKALLKLVEVYYWKKDFPKMKEVALKAREILPNDFTAAYQMAESLRFNGKYEAAAEEYNRAYDLAEKEGLLTKYKVPIGFGIADCAFWRGDLFGVQGSLTDIQYELDENSMVEWDRLCAMYFVLAEEKTYDASMVPFQVRYDDCFSMALKRGNVREEDIQALVKQWHTQFKKTEGE